MIEQSRIEDMKDDDLVGGDISNVRSSEGIATVLSSSKSFENMVAEPEQFQTCATNADCSVRAFIALPCTDTPRIEVDMRCLDDGRVVELIEDPDDETRTKLAVFDSRTTSVVDAVAYRGQFFVPKRRVADGLEDVLLPCAPQAYGSAEELFFKIINLLNKCLAITDAYVYVIGAIVLNSWFCDVVRLPAYLILTGLPQSGKTTLLQMLRLVCRRPLLVGDISTAAVLDACSRFGCTLLIDENEWRADSSGRAFRKQLRAGTSHGMLARQFRRSVHAFGTKILSGGELPSDAALRSRCIHVPMNETDRVDLQRPWDPKILAEAKNIRNQLLQFRLERYAKVAPRFVPGAEVLRPRSRDLLAALLAPLDGEEIIQQMLLAFFVHVHDPSTRNLLSPEQAVIVAALFELVHIDAKAARIQVGTVASVANRILDAAGERLNLNPRKTSNILAGLGFGYRERSSGGSLLLLDLETIALIHKLRKNHEVHWTESEDLQSKITKCEICDRMRISTSTKRTK